MRVITMALLTLVTGLAVIGAWVMLGPGGPSLSNLVGSPAKKVVLKRDKFRSAPYVILVPAEVLPEKISSAPPKTSTGKVVPLAASPPSPATGKPELTMPSTASAPAAKPPPSPKTAPIAKQTLEAILGPQPEPKPPVTPKKQTAAPAVPDPKPEKTRPPAAQTKLKPVGPAAPEPTPEPKHRPAALVKPKPAALASTPAVSPPPSPAREPVKARKPERELTYAIETKSQAGERKKQQSLTVGEQVHFRRVVPQGTGRLKADDTIIVLAGVESLRAGAKCKYPSGKSWDCGRWGKYSLTRFIRGRAVDCDLLDEISETEYSGRCKVAGKDINEWVIRRGWGQPSAENITTYAAALSAAKKDKLGLWSEEPKKEPPKETPPPEPPVTETPVTEIPATGITVTEVPLTETPQAQHQSNPSSSGQ